MLVPIHVRDVAMRTACRAYERCMHCLDTTTVHVGTWSPWFLVVQSRIIAFLWCCFRTLQHRLGSRKHRLDWPLSAAGLSSFLLTADTFLMRLHHKHTTYDFGIPFIFSISKRERDTHVNRFFLLSTAALVWDECACVSRFNDIQKQYRKIPIFLRT